MLNDNEHGMECLKRLNGKIIIVPGNHDTRTRVALYDTLPNVEVLKTNIKGLTGVGAAYFDYEKYRFYISHHPTETANMEKDLRLRGRLINLYGHTHQQTKFMGDAPYQYHVGLDAHNCTPVLLDDAIQDMKAKAIECISAI